LRGFLLIISKKLGYGISNPRHCGSDRDQKLLQLLQLNRQKA